MSEWWPPPRRSSTYRRRPIDVAAERSSTRTAILRSSGLTEKKLTVVGPPGTVVTSAALPGGTTSRIFVSPSRKETSAEADTAGGWTAPSCAAEQNWTEEGAIDTVAATVASGLMSSSMPAEMIRPYAPVSGPALGEVVGVLDAAAVGCA